MSRQSCDQYKLATGELVNVSTMEEPPQGAVLWNGYDYDKQYWVHEGKRDTRTVEELRASLNMPTSECPNCGHADPQRNSSDEIMCENCGYDEAND